MKKSLLISLIIFALFSMPAVASNGKGPQKDLPEQAKKGIETAREHTSAIPFEQPTLSTEINQAKNNHPSENTNTDCNTENEWKNHGEYVSCIAKTHPSGEVVSHAAKSSIGKKSDHEPESPEPSITPTTTPTPTTSPTITPTITPLVTPSITNFPTITPTPKVTISPIPLPLDEQEKAITQQLQEIIDLFRELLQFLNPSIT